MSINAAIPAAGAQAATAEAALHVAAAVGASLGMTPLHTRFWKALMLCCQPLSFDSAWTSNVIPALLCAGSTRA